MDKITTTDCYLPVKGKDTGYSLHTWTGEEWHSLAHLEKHTGMIVLTVEQFEKISGRIFDAGQAFSRDIEYGRKAIGKKEYIVTLLK